MDVSKNSGTPKSSILIGFSIIFTIHFGGNSPVFGNTHIAGPNGSSYSGMFRFQGKTKSTFFSLNLSGYATLKCTYFTKIEIFLKKNTPEMSQTPKPTWPQKGEVVWGGYNLTSYMYKFKVGPGSSFKWTFFPYASGFGGQLARTRIFLNPPASPKQISKAPCAHNMKMGLDLLVLVFSYV